MSDRIRKIKKPAIQLTSLLDLLFVMVFISLLQSKDLKVVSPAPKISPPPVAQPQEVQPKAEIKVPPKKLSPIISYVEGTFHFYGVGNNQSIPEGKFRMQGRYNRESGELELGGSSWIQRPPNYEMVPLKGVINADQSSFTGRIEFEDCQTFILTRLTRVEGSPLAGQWKGTYVCYQGETGLTLTLD